MKNIDTQGITLREMGCDLGMSPSRQTRVCGEQYFVVYYGAVLYLQ